MILITVNCCHLDQHGDNHLIVTPYRAKHDVISQYMSYAWLSPQHVDFVYNLVVIQVPHYCSWGSTDFLVDWSHECWDDNIRKNTM